MSAPEPTLFDVSWREVRDVHGLARYGDPETSVAAAKSITGRTEAQILEAFEDAPGGLNDSELCERLPDVWPDTVKSARSRLSNHAFLVDSGFTRPSTRGRDSIVWKLDSRASARGPVPSQE